MIVAITPETTLHRYFIWANRFRIRFEESVSEPLTSDDLPLLWFSKSGGMYMSYWYSALYVVVEGWKRLELHDADIDRLLTSPNVKHLRTYRNGVCHFQPDYLDPRFLELMASPGSVSWVHELTAAFSKWFLERRDRGKVP